MNYIQIRRGGGGNNWKISSITLFCVLEYLDQFKTINVKKGWETGFPPP